MQTSKPYTVKEAIILAGGHGSRLQSVLPNFPKPVAPLGDRPFLHYVFQYLEKEGVERILLSVGYQRDFVRSVIGKRFGKNMRIFYSEEETPLGTGGAIREALRKAINPTVMVINGDTFFPISIEALSDIHIGACAKVTMALKPMVHFNRYGTVQLDGHAVVRFEEKKPQSEGLINGGSYLVERNILTDMPPEGNFSFELEFLPKLVKERSVFGYVSDNYFIDLGVPEDYARALKECSTWRP